MGAGGGGADQRGDAGDLLFHFRRRAAMHHGEQIVWPQRREILSPTPNDEIGLAGAERS